MNKITQKWHSLNVFVVENFMEKKLHFENYIEPKVKIHRNKND